MDALRLLAIIQMLQGHTLDAVLATHLRDGFVHELWTSARGLTAVLFLVTAGMAFALATAAPTDPGRSRGRVRRALELIGLGYLLHLPVGWAGLTADAVAEFMAVDVLQCIGVGLLLLELIRRNTVGTAPFCGLCGVAALTAFGLAPAAYQLCTADTSPGFLGNYLTTAGGSIFPLLPWVGHMFVGALVGALLAHAPAPRHWRIFAPVALILLLAATAPGQPVLLADHLTRLGSVLAIAALGALVLTEGFQLPGPALALARRSLFIYVVHIVLDYGRGVGLAEVVGPSLDLGPALALTAGLGAAVLWAALVYDRVRLGSRVAAGTTTG